MKSDRVRVGRTVVTTASRNSCWSTTASTGETATLNALLGILVAAGVPVGVGASSRSQQHERLAAGAGDVEHPSWDAG